MPDQEGNLALIGVVIRRRPHCPPGIPSDLQDHERDHESDDRISDRNACGKSSSLRMSVLLSGALRCLCHAEFYCPM